jgi:hypothetical protein
MYIGPYRFTHRGKQTYSIKVHGAVTTISIDRVKPVYVLHVNIESALPNAIPSSITTRSLMVCMRDYLGVQLSKRGVVWRKPLIRLPT